MSTTAFKTMAESQLEGVRVLSLVQPAHTAVESEEAWLARLERQREIIKAYRAGLPCPPGPPPQLHPGHAGPPGAEEAWLARLKRQREIIKAYYQEHCMASQAGPTPTEMWEELPKAA